MFHYFKTVVVILKFISSLFVLRNYGKTFMTFRISTVECFQLVNLESSQIISQSQQSKLRYKFFVKLQKIKCNTKVFFFNLPYTNNNDAKDFHKRILRSALRKRNYKKLKLDKELNNLKSEIRNTINGIKWYLFIQAIQKNV